MMLRRAHQVMLAACVSTLLPLAARSASGEIALMASGKILYIDRFERLDERITLYLEGGGEVNVASEVVLNIVPNEVVDEDTGEQETIREIRLFPHLRELILPAASKYGVEPELVAAVIWAESSGDPNAVSTRGARGLMQLMPETARELGVTRILDPQENVEGGTRYLRRMLDAHEGDLSLALAAYNAGPEAVRRYGGIPPYRETRAYVGRVMRVYEREKEAAE